MEKVKFLVLLVVSILLIGLPSSNVYADDSFSVNKYEELKSEYNLVEAKQTIKKLMRQLKN